ncbi:MAG TPA: hypothetical protein VNA30_04660 [Mycobacteriales bacterium]|nr:hypothetical protein [Mycobacteriales bacterium]
MRLWNARRGAVLVAIISLAALALPAGAAPPTTTVGSPSVPGTSKGFQLVGHTDLGNRGMNSPVAVAGRCSYVGDREYERTRPNAGVAVIDIANPRAPRQVGVIPARARITQRELRADVGLGLLLVLDYSPFIGGASATPGASGNDLQIYDIASDCRRPKLLSTYDFGARTPHEFFLWKDPKKPGRALAYVATTIYGPDLTVLDLSNPTAPKLLTTYDLVADQAFKAQDFPTKSGSGYLHSLAISDDGTRAYMGTWDYGTYVADTSGLADPNGVPVVRPLGPGRLDYGANVHGTVPLHGRPYGVMVQEDYANAGNGCPFGHLRMADLTDPANPTLAGGYRLPENDCAKARAANGTFTAHNQTAFRNVALLTWYAGGLRAVDVSDPNRPVETGVFVPKRADAPAFRDERLFFTGLPRDTRRTGAMWSYPVVQDGLIYVVDIDRGLFILRYTGKHAAEVAQAGFVEGNSSPGRWTRNSPVVRRPASAAAAISALRAPVVVRDTVPLRSRGGKALSFLC